MSESVGIKLVRYLTQKLKAFFFSKDILSFLLFLILSAVVWFGNTLDKEHEATLVVPVKYIGVPVDFAITNNPPTQIRFIVKEQGLYLLRYSKNIKEVEIDLSDHFQKQLRNKSETQIRLSTEFLKAKLVHTLGIRPSSVVLEMQPEFVFIQYQQQKSKRLPVKLLAKVYPAPQYMLSDTLRISPKWVYAYGPRKMLDTMTCIYTNPITFDDVKDTIHTSCTLRHPRLVSLSASKVNLTVCVEPFTEKNIQLPVSSSNFPAGYSMRAFPAYVSVTYTVGISYFNSLKPEDIQVYVDYNDMTDNNQTHQMLRVKNNSIHISNIRIVPQEVEFILEKD